MYAPGTELRWNPPHGHLGIKYGHLVITATFSGRPDERPYIFL